MLFPLSFFQLDPEFSVGIDFTLGTMYIYIYVYINMFFGLFSIGRNTSFCSVQKTQNANGWVKAGMRSWSRCAPTRSDSKQAGRILPSDNRRWVWPGGAGGFDVLLGEGGPMPLTFKKRRRKNGDRLIAALKLHQPKENGRPVVFFPPPPWKSTGHLGFRVFVGGIGALLGV